MDLVVENYRRVVSVRVPLTETRKARLADRLTDLVQTRDRRAAEHKSLVADYREEKAELDKAMTDLAAQVDIGSEMVRCEPMPDHENGVMTYARTDNGEVAESATRPLMGDERQMEMFTEGKEAAAEA